MALSDKLETYDALLRKWQKNINLVSDKTVNDAFARHFEDSLQIAECLPATDRNILDLGSGAGFPGMIIAMSRPETHVKLIESDKKKCTFLRTVARETKTTASVLEERIEEISADLHPADVITARALAPLDKLLTYVWPWVEMNPDVVCLFPKGRTVDDEKKLAEKNWRFDSEDMKSKTASDSVIMKISKIRKTA